MSVSPADYPGPSGREGDQPSRPLSLVSIESAERTVLRDEVAAYSTPHEVTQRGEELAGRVEVLTLPHCRLVFVRYGGDVIVEAPATGDRTIATLPLGPMGVLTGTSNQKTVHDSAFLLSHDERTVMHPDAWAGAWVVAAEAEALEEHRRVVLGEGSDNDGGQAPDVRAGWLDSACRSVWSLARLPGDTPDAVLSAMVTAVESNLMTALALSTSPGESEASSTGDLRVDFLLEWLDVHHHQPITVADMARATGLSVRQLQSSSQRALGQSPMQALRGIRMERSRQLLREADPASTTVAAVAARCGILHPGRFALAYREVYGESPSDTLNRSR